MSVQGRQHGLRDFVSLVCAGDGANATGRNAFDGPNDAAGCFGFAEMVAERNAGFTYSLLSQWAVNKQNMPRTAVETEGLKAVVADPTKPFYKEETLGGTSYFTAVYPDKAISQACVSCHNAHKDSPRTDFKLNDVMGGVVLRIPMQ